MEPLKKVTHIIVHHSQGENLNTVEKIKSFHKKVNKWEDIGYHYLIKEGILYTGRSEKFQGAHVKGHNKNSIGICLIGNLDKKRPTKQQIQTLIKFLKAKMKQYNIPKENVLGHNEIPGVTKTCPGKLTNMNEIRKTL